MAIVREDRAEESQRGNSNLVNCLEEVVVEKAGNTTMMGYYLPAKDKYVCAKRI